jgi:hypothetical protein
VHWKKCFCCRAFNRSNRYHFRQYFISIYIKYVPYIKQFASSAGPRHRIDLDTHKRSSAKAASFAVRTDCDFPPVRASWRHRRRRNAALTTEYDDNLLRWAGFRKNSSSSSSSTKQFVPALPECPSPPPPPPPPIADGGCNDDSDLTADAGGWCRPLGRRRGNGVTMAQFTRRAVEFTSDVLLFRRSARRRWLRLKRRRLDEKRLQSSHLRGVGNGLGGGIDAAVVAEYVVR